MYAALTVGTVLPVALIDLVASQMYIFTGKQFEKFRPDILAKFKDPILTRTQRRGKSTAPRTASGTSQPRITIDRLKKMSGHVDFRHYVDSPCRRISHHFADIFTGIIPAVERIPSLDTQPPGRNQKIGIALPRGASQAQRVLSVEMTPGSLLRQFRVTPDLDPPPLIVSQMPMKLVEFEPGHLIQQCQYFLLAEKMPAYVEHHPAPFERRFVGNLHTGNPGPGTGSRGQHLTQRGNPVDNTPVRSARDPDAAARHRQPVSLRGQCCGIELQYDIAPTAPIDCNGGAGRQHLIQITSSGDKLRIGNTQPQLSRQPEGPTFPNHLLRQGNKHGALTGRGSGTGRKQDSGGSHRMYAYAHHDTSDLHHLLIFAVARPFIRRASVSSYCFCRLTSSPVISRCGTAYSGRPQRLCSSCGSFCRSYNSHSSMSL